jgi:hypothetical protein
LSAVSICSRLSLSLSLSLSDTHTHTITRTGSLSGFFLADIVKLFTDKMANTKGEGPERSFSTYQKAILSLQFGFGQGTKELTIEYLRNLRDFLPSIQRGVLKIEVSSSLAEVFTNLMCHKSEQQKAEFVAFQREPGRYKAFMEIFEGIYKSVYKWSKNAKYSEKCLDLMWKMEVYSNSLEFYRQEANNCAFKSLVSALSNKDLRISSLKAIHGYCKSIPLAFVIDDGKKFNDRMTSFAKVSTMPTQLTQRTPRIPLPPY